MATDTLSSTLAALADPTRRAILDRLATGPATVKELSAPFAMRAPPSPSISGSSGGPG